MQRIVEQNKYLLGADLHSYCWEIDFPKHEEFLLGIDFRSYSWKDVQTQVTPERHAYPRLPSKNSVPRGYDGIRTPTDLSSEALGSFIGRLQKAKGSDPQAIVQSFAVVVGPIFSDRAKATRFEDGVLHVTVRDASTLMMLAQMEYGRVLAKIRELNPQASIRKIKFSR